MVSLLPTKFHEILFSSFRGFVLTNEHDKNNMSPIKVGGDIIIYQVFCIDISFFLDTGVRVYGV